MWKINSYKCVQFVHVSLHALSYIIHHIEVQYFIYIINANPLRFIHNIYFAYYWLDWPWFRLLYRVHLIIEISKSSFEFSFNIFPWNFQSTSIQKWISLENEFSFYFDLNWILYLFDVSITKFLEHFQELQAFVLKIDIFSIL